jgi:hypothetical protein
MSDASQTKLSFRDEDIWGEDPTLVSPNRAGREFRFTSESLNFNQETAVSEEIRDDRNISDIVRVSAESAGDVNIESSFGSHDPLIEGAMFDNWEAAVDVNEGTSPGDNATVTVTANITSPLSASTGTISIPSASPDFFAPVRVGSFVQLSGSGSPDVDGFYLVTAKPAIGNLTVQPSPPVSTSGAFRVRSSGIRNGIIFKSFLIEKEFRDVAQFFAFSGMRVGVWAETIAPGAILTGNFGFQGETVVTAQASIFSSSPTVESLIATNDVFNAVDNIDNVLINGVDQSATLCFTEISFSLDNQLRALPCIGQLENFDIGAGQVAVTGTLVSYFENLLLYNQFRNFTNVRLSFTATDLNGNTYLYFFPNFKLTSGEVIAGGNNTDVLASFEYTVRRDPTFGFAMGVNRFANTRSELLPGTADQA